MFLLIFKFKSKQKSIIKIHIKIFNFSRKYKNKKQKPTIIKVNFAPKKRNRKNRINIHKLDFKYIHLVGIDGITDIYIHGPVGSDQELAGCLLNPHRGWRRRRNRSYWWNHIYPFSSLSRLFFKKESQQLCFVGLRVWLLRLLQVSYRRHRGKFVSSWSSAFFCLCWRKFFWPSTFSSFYFFLLGHFL